MTGNDKDLTLIYDGNPLLEEALVLPDQFYPEKGWHAPEQYLIGAMVIDALEILVGKRAAKQYQWERDKEWLLADTEEPFDFLWCCRMLNLNHFTLRTLVKKHLKPPLKPKARRPAGSFTYTDEAKAKFRQLIAVANKTVFADPVALANKRALDSAIHKGKDTDALHFEIPKGTA